MFQQLELELKTVCRQSSLSRRFNEVLEFLTKLQEDPSYFLKSRSDQDPVGLSKVEKFHVMSKELNTIIDEINAKKACNNPTFIDRNVRVYK